MQTNFFSLLASLGLEGNFRLNIQRQSDNKMVVSALLVREEIKDKSVNQIPALVLSGFTDDLDKGFFESIQQPVQRQNTLLCNLAAHESALNKTQKESEGKQITSTSASSPKRRKFDEQMKKVNEMEKQQKYGQAIGLLPKEKDFPEFTSEISKKLAELKSKHGSLSLFGNEEEASTEITSDDESEDASDNEQENNNDDDYDDNDANDDVDDDNDDDN